METLCSFPIVLGLGPAEEVALSGFGLIVAAVLVCGVIVAFLLRSYLKIIVDLFINTQIPGFPDPSAQLEGEPVEFETADGVKLSAVYSAAPNAQGRTIIFCQEYGSNMNSAARYHKFLRAAGFNVFAFDFRGHGSSANRDGYVPKQWLTTYEIADLEAAIKYVQGRQGAGPYKIGLLGLSRGACACVCAASRSEAVKAVVAEGVFATKQILVEGMKRWVSVYAHARPLHPWLPDWFFTWLRKVSMRRAEEMLQCRFVAVEDFLPRLAPRPLLMIHGEKDSYVSVAHAQRLFEGASPPKEFWVVPSARHNEGARVAGGEYEQKVTEFFQQHLN
jgi:pimeloyl-ACP methyl ester carboxylesterase